MMHFLASHPNVKAIFPVTSKHFKIVPIKDISKKIEDIKKLFLSFEKPF